VIHGSAPAPKLLKVRCEKCGLVAFPPIVSATEPLICASEAACGKRQRRPMRFPVVKKKEPSE
jgi:uncharacterized OB-fold protein